MAKVGIIGGSGLYDIDGFTNIKEVVVETPFGAPSDVYMCGEIDGVKAVFLPRHGKGHRLNPTEVNYRANIFGMKKLGVEAIISISAVGSLKEQYAPTDFVVPDQFIDRTRHRKDTFFENGIVAHVAFADPISPEVAGIVVAAAKEVGATVHQGGVYVNMEGPQFSTKAESYLYRSWGADVIGMTNMTEARLAREAEISYATLAGITDYDCWHDTHETVTAEMIIGYLMKNVAKAKEILKHAIPQVGRLTEFSAANALQNAIIRSPDQIPVEIKKNLEPIIGKYMN